MKFYIYIIISLISFLLSACIKNDIPYPRVIPHVLSFEVQGAESCIIDNNAQQINIILSDTVNIARVHLLKFKVSDSAAITPEPVSILDLSTPIEYTLTTYQEYIWTVSATQNVLRYFTVKGQFGQSVIDLNNHIVSFSVTKNIGLDNITVLSAKLGAEGSAITPDILNIKDFTTPVEVTNIYFDKEQKWTIIGAISESTYNTTSVNAFAKYAFIEGNGEVGVTDYGFEYKLKGESTWIEVQQSSIIYNNGVFTAELKNLTPGANYIVRATQRGNYANEIEFTTELALQVPNSDFNLWCNNVKTIGSMSSAIERSWFPDLNLEPENYWWDSGNIGANTLSKNNITVPEDIFVVSGRAAKLSSKKIMGFFAAGSVYTGKYMKTEIPGAILNFGKEFASRPKSLKGYYSYSPGVVNEADQDHKQILNNSDTCSIYAILTSWSAPFEVNTKKGVFVDFNAPYVIAICELYSGVSTGDIYKEFNIDFKYKDSLSIPSYILIVASASKYGDYFTGSTSSILYIDQFELIY